MTTYTKQHSILNNHVIKKGIALCLGIIVWHMVSTFHTSSITLTLPVKLVNTSDTMHYQAPEKIEVTLKGSKAELKTLNFSSLTVYLDAKKYSNSPKNIRIFSRHLHLPPHIRIIRVNPSYIAITATPKTVTE